MSKSTINEIKTNVEEINNLVLNGKTMDAFEKFYSEDVIMVQADGSITTGKDECRQMEEKFMASITEFRGTKCLNYTIAETTHTDFDVVVVALWFLDVTTEHYTMTGDQMSITHWKEGKVVHERYFYPAEHTMIGQ